MKKETMSRFLAELTHDLENTIDENIDMQEIKDKKNILIIRSAKKDFFDTFLKKLKEVNSTARISVVGDMTDYDNCDYSIEIDDLYVHYSKIDDHFTGEMMKVKKLHEVDAIIFLNYEIFRSTYANVSRLATRLATISGADVYSYQVRQEKFNKYKNIQLFQEGLDNITGVARMCEMLLVEDVVTE